MRCPTNWSTPFQSPTGATAAWWGGLSAGERRAVVTLLDGRQDSCFFGATAGGETPPAVEGGRFLPHDDAWGLSEWDRGG